MSEVTNIKDKVLHLGLTVKSFIPEGQAEPVTYHQVLLVIRVNGEDIELPLKLNADKARLIRAADTVAESTMKKSKVTILDDEE